MSRYKSIVKVREDTIQNIYFGYLLMMCVQTTIYYQYTFFFDYIPYTQY